MNVCMYEYVYECVYEFIYVFVNDDRHECMYVCLLFNESEYLFIYVYISFNLSSYYNILLITSSFTAGRIHIFITLIDIMVINTPMKNAMYKYKYSTTTLLFIMS